LLTGWGGLHQADLPDTVFKLDSIPHDWLFPRMAAIVHHGGSGTTAASLRAGVPSVVIPFFGDQPLWGRRVHLLDAAPEPIPRKQLSVERLADAISDAVSNLKMREHVMALGEKIRAEDGVGVAVAAFNRHNCSRVTI
jgi:sterol 3beta-glucosyltransferase